MASPETLIGYANPSGPYAGMRFPAPPLIASREFPAQQALRNNQLGIDTWIWIALLGLLFLALLIRR